jgi:hypothetical protein
MESFCQGRANDAPALVAKKRSLFVVWQKVLRIHWQKVGFNSEIRKDIPRVAEVAHSAKPIRRSHTLYSKESSNLGFIGIRQPERTADVVGGNQSCCALLKESSQRCNKRLQSTEQKDTNSYGERSAAGPDPASPQVFPNEWEKSHI